MLNCSHLLYTIPPALALSLCYRPLGTALDVYKILFLISVSLGKHVEEKINVDSVQVAVISTTPWDSYLISSRIWSYPPNAIVGPTFFKIPAEELFFFVVQTYITSLLYLFLSKPILHPIYLRSDAKRLRIWRSFGTIVGLSLIISGLLMIQDRGRWLYMGLILVWAMPFVLLLWSVALSPSEIMMATEHA